MAIQKGIKIIAENRKAYHDYFIEERFEAGVALSGTEVKSLRAGRINLKDSYVQVKDGEIWLINILLLKKCEICRMMGLIQKK